MVLYGCVCVFRFLKHFMCFESKYRQNWQQIGFCDYCVYSTESNFLSLPSKIEGVGKMEFILWRSYTTKYIFTKWDTLFSNRIACTQTIIRPLLNEAGSKWAIKLNGFSSFLYSFNTELSDTYTTCFWMLAIFTNVSVTTTEHWTQFQYSK